ncbi:MAG: sodium:proton antiporter, partial [Candidatus Omnitrophica bacterium]|nr:sodium:proton antiporter [Candidatus Omnitrophota bacterium]
MSLYFLCFILFCVGIYSVLRKRNIIKIIIGLGIIEYAVNLFFILIGYRMHGRAPIYSQDQQIVNMVDPLPQAIVMTTIVIGLALTAVVV